jgi:hypothetical protein
MRSFIPEEDRAEFEAFLIENSLPLDQSGNTSISVDTKPHPPPPPPATQVVPQSSGGEGRRGRNRRVSGARVADMDKFLADIDSHAEAMMDTSNF